MTHQFTVAGMTCGHCVSRVATALRRRDPEARIGVDLTAGKVSVDGAGVRSDYAEALRDAGYTAA
jgi:copper chaperone